MKRIAILWVILALLGSLCVPAAAASEAELRSAVAESAEYVLASTPEPQIGSVGGEWAVLALARSGYDVPQAYWDSYYRAVEQAVRACKGILHERKYTEYSRVVLALTAIGADPRDIAGYDLLKPLGDFEKTVWQGLNGPVWALIALDSGGYEMPENRDAQTQATRQMYIDEILSRQLKDGGWSLSGNAAASDGDMTGMALQALANYQGQPAVKAAIERAISFLSSVQEADGGYSSYGLRNSESIVQVIVALCELGISLEDPRFVKEGNSLLDSLLRYRRSDGGFCHTAGGTDANQMTSEQGLYGLAAALRAAEGKNSLYRMGDTTINSVGNTASGAGLPGKHADVKKVAASLKVSFADMNGQVSRNAVEALAARGILGGFGDGTFRPNAAMSRAQFAAVVVRALGLPLQDTRQFTDVKPTDWHAAYVGSAYAYGIVNGRTADTFDPNGTITRQQAAAMVARAAKLCGLDTSMEEYEILHILVRFDDDTAVGQWAKESVAFCYAEGILNPEELSVEPNRAILRGEIAQMLYQLLDRTELL